MNMTNSLKLLMYSYSWAMVYKVYILLNLFLMELFYSVCQGKNDVCLFICLISNQIFRNYYLELFNMC